MTDKSDKELKQWIDDLPVEDGVRYCLDEDGNKRYFVGSPIMGVTCNVRPFSMEEFHGIPTEVFSKIIDELINE